MDPINFSIILPAYQTPPEILKRAIQSVLNQTHLYFELIIVDDGTVPSLEPIVKEFSDKRIIYFRNEQNMGSGYTANRAIKNSKYNWIAIICHDDEWLPSKLEKQLELIKRLEINNEPACIFSGIYYTSDYKKIETAYIDFIPSHVIDYNYLLNYFPPINSSTLVLHKKIFDDIGLYDETGVLVDLDLFLRIKQKGYKFYHIPEPLIIYYKSTLGISNKKSIFLNSPKAGNDIIKFYYKWQKEIFKQKSSRKIWSKRLNCFVHWYFPKNKNMLKLYIEAIRLDPFWRGNYVDLFKYFILRKKYDFHHNS